MSGNELISVCAEMTPRQLIGFARSDEAVRENQWMALALSLASKLEAELAHHAYRDRMSIQDNHDAVLAASAADYEVPE